MTQQAASGVPEKATQGAEARRRGQWWWTEASIWTERMVSALGNGVKGGKWCSLMDKVVRPTTLGVAWRKVARNHGAAGVDGQSIERFAAQAERYLQELQHGLENGSLREGFRMPARGDLSVGGEGRRPKASEEGTRGPLAGGLPSMGI